MQVRLAGLDDRAFDTRLRLREALALAGILALASIGRALAGALTLAGIGASTVHIGRRRSGDEHAGREHGCRRGRNRLLVHLLHSLCLPRLVNRHGWEEL